MRKRAIDKTDPAVLAEYGNGYYPLRWVYDKGEMADNGNYIEPQAISVRHGVCGDPRQVQRLTVVVWLTVVVVYVRVIVLSAAVRIRQ